MTSRRSEKATGATKKDGSNTRQISVERPASGGSTIVISGQHDISLTGLTVMGATGSQNAGIDVLDNSSDITIANGLISGNHSYGIDVIHQDLALAPDLTVTENVYLGHEQLERGWRGRLGVLARPAMGAEAAAPGPGFRTTRKTATARKTEAAAISP